MNGPTLSRPIACAAFFLVMALPLQGLVCAETVESCPMQTERQAPGCHAPEAAELEADCCLASPAPVPAPGGQLLQAPLGAVPTPVAVATAPALVGHAVLADAHPARLLRGGVPLFTLLVTFLN